MPRIWILQSLLQIHNPGALVRKIGMVGVLEMSDADCIGLNWVVNTDGIDTYRSDRITIKNWVVQNGDDCVAFKGSAFSTLHQPTTPNLTSLIAEIQPTFSLAM